MRANKTTKWTAKKIQATIEATQKRANYWLAKQRECNAKGLEMLNKGDEIASALLGKFARQAQDQVAKCNDLLQAISDEIGIDVTV